MSEPRSRQRARTRVGLIVDNRSVARWQADCLRTLAADHEFIIYNCTNSRPSRRHARHALYYLLNLWAIRNPMARAVPLPAELDIVGIVDFESEFQGAWQRLPQWLNERIAADKPPVVVKFGMGLLRVPPSLRAPFLSYHHGDPGRFRGRPAGYYELDGGCDRLGQIVQILSDELDAGAVVAFAETRVHKHSYRATLTEAFRTSPLLLRPAIANALSGKTIPFDKGPTFRLPSNLSVARFCLARLKNSVGRFLYGALIEKRWQVAQAPLPSEDPTLFCSRFPSINQWQVFPVPRGYSFIADPFFHPSEDGILAEGLSSTRGRGDILHLTANDANRLSFGEGHCSYPSTLSSDGHHFIIPEIAAWSPAGLYRLDDGRVEMVASFEIDGSPRLLDPTVMSHEGNFYLFGNRSDEGPGVLRLWSSQSLRERFTEHPASPLRISPFGSRMAGNVLAVEARLFRWGQILTGRYGDGVVLFAIEQLSPAEYREVEYSMIRFKNVRGPHTVNVRNGQVLFDFYRDRISPLAGLRRYQNQSNG